MCSKSSSVFASMVKNGRHCDFGAIQHHQQGLFVSITCLANKSFSTQAEPQPIQSDAKPLSEIPGPRGLPFIGNLLDLPKLFANQDNMHNIVRRNFEHYGPIWKQKIGNFATVHLSDVDAVEKLHRFEGKYPRRITLAPWINWREEQGLAKGVLIQ